MEEDQDFVFYSTLYFYLSVAIMEITKKAREWKIIYSSTFGKNTAHLHQHQCLGTSIVGLRSLFLDFFNTAIV